MKPIKLKLFKIAAFIISIILLLAAAGAGFFIYLFPKESLLKIVMSQTEQALKRKVTAGDLEYSPVGIRLKSLVIYNNLTGDEGTIATVDRLDLGFSILSLLKKNININRIYLNKLKLNASFTEDGSSQFEKLISDLKSDSSAKDTQFNIDIIELSESEINISETPKAYEPLEGRYIIDATFDLRERNRIKASKCRLKLPENRGALMPELLIKISNNDFEITGDVELNQASLLWVYRFGDDVKQPYNVVNGKVYDLVINKKKVQGHVKARSSMINSTKTTIADGYCSVDIINNILHIYDVNGRIDSSTFYINNISYNIDSEDIEFALSKIDADLADASAAVRQIPAKAYGNAKGSISYKKGLFNSSLNLNGVGYDKDEKLLTGISTDLMMKDNDFKIENAHAQLTGNNVQVSVAATGSNIKKLFIFVTADNFIINDRIKTEDAKGTDFPFEITGKIAIGNLAYDDIIFKNMNIIYSGIKNEILISNFQSEFMGGEVNGKASVLFSENQPKANISASFNGVKVQEIVALSDNFKNRFFGIAAGMVNVNFTPGRGFLNSIYGRMEFDIDNGKLVDTGIQNGLGIWLSELKYKLKDLEFNSISGDFNIAGKNYIINSFVFNSNDIKLKIAGAFNQEFLAEKNISIDLEFNQNFIQDLPRPAVALMGIERSPQTGWYYIPFAVKGKITDSANIKRLK